jgi:hypothetical protein
MLLRLNSPQSQCHLEVAWRGRCLPVTKRHQAKPIAAGHSTGGDQRRGPAPRTTWAVSAVLIGHIGTLSKPRTDPVGLQYRFELFQLMRRSGESVSINPFAGDNGSFSALIERLERVLVAMTADSGQRS